MTNDKQYPRVLHAVEDIEFGKWPLVDALLAEVERKDRTGPARPGELDRVAGYLADNGYPGYSRSHLSELLGLGRWLETFPARQKFEKYPVSLVRVARIASGGDYDDALRILGEKASFRQIEGRPTERRPRTPLEKLSAATFIAWEVQELLMEEGGDIEPEDRVLMLSLAEKLQRLGQVIVQQIESGTTDIDLDQFYIELEEFKAAN